MKRDVCLILCLFCIPAIATAASSSQTFGLWSGPIPSALGTAEQDIPTLTVYQPSTEKTTDAAVVICPGGGYGHLAMDHEGKQIAECFNTMGITAFVLKYRLPSDGYRHPVPLMDAQRAIRLVRSRAEEWKINPNKIGIIGFSAGGHLASSAGTHFEKPVSTGDLTDEIDSVSCRPDFMVLVYPVISMVDGITHQGSKRNLLGDNPDPALVTFMSNEKQVTRQTPPTFLVHASDDRAVPPANSVLFYQACQAAEVPVEMHLFLKGGHGFGIRPSAGPAAGWSDLCKQWLQQLDFLSK